MTRAEIIEYLYDNNVHGDLKIEDMADDLAEPQWIPCSSGELPDYGVPVWITIKEKCTTRKPNVFLASREKRSRFFEEHWCTEEFSRFNYKCVTAWMPAEPYKEGEEHD